MELRTNENVISLKLKLGETLCVNFSPGGLNEPLFGGPTIGLVVSTISLPGGKMGVSIKMPRGNTFEALESSNACYPSSLVRFLVDNPLGVIEQTFVLNEAAPRLRLALRRIE